MASDPERPSWMAVVLMAMVYAVCIAALILYAPVGEHVFVYQAF